MGRYLLNKRAFLTDMALALGVMLLMIGGLFPVGAHLLSQTKETRMTNDLNTVAYACRQYYLSTGHWPAQVSDLQPNFLSDNFDGSSYILNPQANIIAVTSGHTFIYALKPTI